MPRQPSKQAGPSYLKQRRLGWYVQVPVPRALHAAVGSKVLTRSLSTRDLSEARRRSHATIAELQSLIKQAAAKASSDGTPTTQDLLQGAGELRAAQEAGEATDTDVEASFDRDLDRYLDVAARRYGRDPEGHPRLPPAELATVRRAKRVLAGRADNALTTLIDQYLKESQQHLRAQTLGDKRRHLQAFAAWFGADREVTEVTRKTAGGYVSEVIQNRTRKAPDGTSVPLAAVTRRSELSALRAFFDWVAARGIIESNPFDRMASTVRASTRGGKPKRRPWTPSELSAVLHGVPANDPIWALTVLAAYTGMRREEVGELKVSSVDGGVLLVEEGKTAAAVRRVPIHHTIAPLVRKLAKSTTDNYLIPGLLRGGPDRKRAWYVGKRFGRVIRDLGVTDPALDFHALRGTFITQLEAAGVPESTIQLIVGHKRQGMTFGVYSGGVPDTVKRDAIAHITYGKALDNFVAKSGPKVNVMASAKPRKRI